MVALIFWTIAGSIIVEMVFSTNHPQDNHRAAPPHPNNLISDTNYVKYYMDKDV